MTGRRLLRGSEATDDALRTAWGEDCWNCGHPLAHHSGEYQGWDRRSTAYNSVKQPGTGCTLAGCPCRRWFERPNDA